MGMVYATYISLSHKQKAMIVYSPLRGPKNWPIDDPLMKDSGSEAQRSWGSEMLRFDAKMEGLRWV